MTRVTIKHPTDRPNFALVYLPTITVAFSYETPIAYNDLYGVAWVVRENEWGATTGKHLNFIDDGKKAARIPGDEFEKRLSERLTRKLPIGAPA